MKPLIPPDTHHLAAAAGWLELGNHVEADAELDCITPALRIHPDVLQLRWAIYYAAKKFETCYDIGCALVKNAPDRSNGWRHRAASIHYLKRSREAYDLLFPALAKFPDDWSVYYDMACYACVNSNHVEARQHLERAIDLGDPKAVKLMALDDPDLEQLWTEIGQI